MAYSNEKQIHISMCFHLAQKLCALFVANQHDSSRS